MCTESRTIIHLAVVALTLLITFSQSAPSGKISEKSEEVEAFLDRFLNAYYDRYVKKQVEDEVRHLKVRTDDDAVATDDGVDETMQGDQPVAENEGVNQGYSLNYTNPYREALNRHHTNDLGNGQKETYLRQIKNNILEHLGRGNVTVPRTDPLLSSLNISKLMPSFINSSNVFSDDHITEKMRSFYPSCEMPVNTDQDAWKDDDIMNLFFNFDYISNDKNSNIATATLRLYRLPENGTQSGGKSGDCDNEDEKLLRVSIYWYTKSLKKRRAKRKLADSKVISEYSRWVELSVKPAAKAWTKGRNLGLGVLVEDQDGNMLQAEKYFKGASCTVGTSTPQPIPTIIKDELYRAHGRNSTPSVYSDLQLPTIDICTLEFPENYTQPPHIMNLRVNACNLRKIHEQNQRLAEKERLERLVTLPEFFAPSSRHIRHQRQFLANKKNENEGSNRDADPRSRMVGATVLFTRDEWQNWNLSDSGTSNFSTVNR